MEKKPKFDQNLSEKRELFVGAAAILTGIGVAGEMMRVVDASSAYQIGLASSMLTGLSLAGWMYHCDRKNANKHTAYDDHLGLK